LEERSTITIQNVQLVLIDLHQNYEVMNEYIPPLNKFEKGLHAFHQQQNTSQLKQQVFVRQKAQVILPQNHKNKKRPITHGMQNSNIKE
jgi:hypothetical protein